MTTQAAWIDANQLYLTQSLTRVRRQLESRSAAESETPEGMPPDMPPFPADLGPPPALGAVCAVFGLSPFERDTLLLCAGVELDADFASTVAAAQGSTQPVQPTLGLALASLPDPHWSAMAPSAPLRFWRLIELDGKDLTRSPLRIDEWILHYLAGLHQLDERFAGLIEPIYATSSIVPSHRSLAERVAAVWGGLEGHEHVPVVQLCGRDRGTARGIAQAACTKLGLPLHAADALALPIEPRELEALVRLWNREALLTGSALLIHADVAEGDAPRERVLDWFIAHAFGPLVVTAVDPIATPGRASVMLHVEAPTHHEQRALWDEALATSLPSLDGQVDGLVAQFNLDAGAIHSVASEVLHSDAIGRAASGDTFTDALWDACRERVRPRMEGLAQRIPPLAEWDDLVLPDSQLTLLREIAAHVRHRMKVYETWAFAKKSARGLGISALFVGQSGTGKTMAAEVLANKLRLDLYRIDLSQVVSKYIGETEKNLRKVFDAAEGSGAILLFDEADALFGKRSEVKDSHDRYANIEISYLLQRMEDYRGLAILTTNMKGALDQAFLRRIRFVVRFPFPDLARRAAIWRGAFPEQTPTTGIDLDKLARLGIAGGNIRNIAMYAAFLAADADEAVGMPHLLRATRVEYAKLEKTPTEAEIGGWV